MRTSLSLILLVAACSAPSPRRDPTSRGLRASEHLDEARDHSARSNELASWPDRRATQDPDGQLAAGRWSRSFDTTQVQAQAARAHRGEAAALQAEFDEACRDRAFVDMSMSPLQRYGKGGTPTSEGVRVFLSSYAGKPDALMAEIRCHRAWMMLAPPVMESCPLNLPGLRINAVGDANGVTVDISISNPDLVPELQRRTMLDLEGARTHGDRGHE
jgi:hypothetical protein